MPFDCGSVTPRTAFAALAASTALPPRSRICTPAPAARGASGWVAATIPYVVATRDRPAITGIPSSYTVLKFRCDRVGERRDRKERRDRRGPQRRARVARFAGRRALRALCRPIVGPLR